MRYVVFIILISFLFTQTELYPSHYINDAGVLPEITLTKSNSSGMIFTGKILSYQSTYQSSNEISGFNYQTGSTLLQVFTGYKLKNRSLISMGYQYGIKINSPDYHRIIEQYNIDRKIKNLKLKNRFRTDQTFYPDNDFKLRVRYKVGLQIPLATNSEGVPKTYFSTADEPILISQSNVLGFENRISTLVGYSVSSHHQLSFGLDFRTQSFNGLSQNELWLRMGWSIRIG